MLLLGVPGSLVGVVVVDPPGGCGACIADRLPCPALSSRAGTPLPGLAAPARSDEPSVSLTADQTTSVRLPALLWTASQTHHGEVLDTPFMATLTARVLPWKAYADLLAQLYFLHESLALAEDIMAPLRSTLPRSSASGVPALVADLRFLYGPRWQQSITAYPATAAYCADLRDIAVREASGFSAHHYARHVEDLLTGPDLAPAASVAYGLDRAGCLFLRPSDCTARRYHDHRHRPTGGAAELAPNPSRLLAAVARVQPMYLAILQDLERSWT